MSRCKELRQAFGEHYVCNLCDKNQLRAGDIVKYKGLSYRVEDQIPNTLGGTSYLIGDWPIHTSEQAFAKLANIRHISYIPFFQVLGRKIFNLSFKNVYWAEALDSGEWAYLEYSRPLRFSVLNTTEDLIERVRQELKSDPPVEEDEWLVATIDHNLQPIDIVFDIHRIK